MNNITTLKQLIEDLDPTFKSVRYFNALSKLIRNLYRVDIIQIENLTKEFE